jgi:pilus assembly protein CpaC
LLCAGVALRAPAQDVPARTVIVPINVTKVVATTGKALIEKIENKNPAIVRANPSETAKEVVFTGLVPGLTRVFVTDTEKRTEAFDVVVQSDVEYLRFMLKRVMPTASIEPIPSGNNVFILSGTVAKVEDIPIILQTAQSIVGAGIINALRVGGVMQVQLDVVIAEVSRSELRQMGFSFIDAGQQHFITSVLTSGNSTTLTNAISPAAVTGLLQNAPNLAFGFVNDQQGFLSFLQALRTEGLAKFLAEPRLTTLSGKPASFLSGGRLAVPEPSGLGTNAVRFEDFGTQLNFLPIVLGNGKIYLEVEPIVNTINQQNGTVIQGTAVPGFDTQRLHTQVEMEPGQTFALGGLVQHTVNAAASRVPVVGDIPFLNWFFSSKSYNETETELLILVTPHLVDAMACDQLPRYLPGQETRSPDDFELFLEGLLELPRGQREVCVGGHYLAAYKNSPNAGTFPCAGTGGACGRGCDANGHCYGPAMAPTALDSTPVPHGAPVTAPAPAPSVLPARTAVEPASAQTLAPAPSDPGQPPSPMPSGSPAGSDGQ